MKKRIISLVLALTLLTAVLALLPQGIAVSVTFVSTNDNLMELGVYTPISSGGTTYIPGGVFSEGLGVVYSYNASTKMAILYTSARTLIFDMVENNAFDQDGNIYNSAAIARDGKAYLPLDFVCSMYGLYYSWNSTEYGSLLRIKNSNAVLTDSTFITAASSLMKTRYDAYVGTSPAVSMSSAAPASGPVVSAPRPVSSPPVLISTVRLNIYGALDEQTGQLLDFLDSRGIRAAFFTDSESLDGFPDLVRRMYGTGHALGADCDTVTEAEAFNDALDAVLMTRTRLVSAAGGEAAEELLSAGYIPCSYNTVAAFSEGSIRPVGDTVSRILQHIGSAASVVRIDYGENTTERLKSVIELLGSCNWETTSEVLN